MVATDSSIFLPFRARKCFFFVFFDLKKKKSHSFVFEFGELFKEEGGKKRRDWYLACPFLCFLSHYLEGRRLELCWLYSKTITNRATQLFEASQWTVVFLSTFLDDWHLCQGVCGLMTLFVIRKASLAHRSGQKRPQFHILSAFWGEQSHHGWCRQCELRPAVSWNCCHLPRWWCGSHPSSPPTLSPAEGDTVVCLLAVSTHPVPDGFLLCCFLFPSACTFFFQMGTDFTIIGNSFPKDMGREKKEKENPPKEENQQREGGGGEEHQKLMVTVFVVVLGGGVWALVAYPVCE